MRWFVALTLVAAALGLTLTVLLVGSSLGVGGERIADCCCESETIDLGNNDHLHDQLQKLRTFTFFSLFKVNLQTECPFWRENPQCSRINCAVCGQCRNEDLPAPWRIPTTSPVDRTLTPDFQRWRDRDETLWICQDDESRDISYINLQLNPEGYTGYEGFAPHRIWSAIYDENCFHLPDASHQTTVLPPMTSSPFAFGIPTPPKKNAMLLDENDDEPHPAAGIMQPAVHVIRDEAEFASLCYEQRVLYRLLSGLHASISTHIAASYPIGAVDPSADLHAPENCALVGANVTVWQERVGKHPDRWQNMYFAFVFMARAVNKAQATLRTYNYDTGNATEDAELRRTMHAFLDSPLVTSCSSQASFDESTMFASPLEGDSLRLQLRAAFRNISRIIDCVGCEKCKLHGKLQILGLGTALKILFQHDPTPLRLERNEVMALIVTLAKFSHSLKVSHDMARRRDETASNLLVGCNPTTSDMIRAWVTYLAHPDVLLPVGLVALVGALVTLLFVLARRCTRTRPKRA